MGAGISGLTSAVLLKKKGYNVEVFETRHHIGGLCHDFLQNGLVFQHHGPHIFHTSDLETWEFVGRFAGFYPFDHVVMARTEIGMFPIPFNRKSAEIVGDLSVERIRDLVFREYSEKQWCTSWSELPDSITKRVPPKRDSYDCRYTLDEWQGVPTGGFGRMFECMADGLKIHLSVDKDAWCSCEADLVVYTGRLDEYFDCSLGELEYRSARFVHRREPVRKFPIINECMHEVPWTRSTDHSHWNGAAGMSKTTVTYEYPCDVDHGEPLYPVPFGPSVELAKSYREMAMAEKNTKFIGRMAEHAYVDMHVAVKKALEMFG